MSPAPAPTVAPLTAPGPGSLPFEVVERKGMGHPDTICDAPAEQLSVALSRAYRERFGVILHHNVDRGLLSAGAARPAFGGGEVEEPIVAVLGARDRAVDLGVLGRAEAGTVLIHEVQVGLPRDLLGEEGEHLVRPGDPARQHEETALRDPVLVEDQVANLAVHLTYGGPIHFDVGAHLGVSAREVGVAVLHVRHVDVDDAVEQGERLEAVVTAGVVDERKPQAPLRRLVHGGDDLGDHVARRDEIDVVAALVLELEHHARDLGRVHLAADPLLRDVPVLTVHAAETAPREEDRARAPPAANRILLAVVGAVARDDCTLAGTAHRAGGRHAAVDVAVPGAEVAVLEMPVRLVGAARDLAALEERHVGGHDLRPARSRRATAALRRIRARVHHVGRSAPAISGTNRALPTSPALTSFPSRLRNLATISSPPGPIGCTSRPSSASCSTSAGGTKGNAAATMTAWKGARLGPEHAVAEDDHDIVDAGGDQILAGLRRQVGQPLDRVDPAYEGGEDRRLIAEPGPDLEDPLVAPQVERLDHHGDERRLGRHLPVSDRDRAVGARECRPLRRHKPLARNRPNRLEDACIAHPRAPGGVDEHRPRTVPRASHFLQVPQPDATSGGHLLGIRIALAESGER
jgi:hypothetical protein